MAKKLNIFGKKPTTASTPSKSDKPVVVVDGLEEKLLEFDFMKSQIADLEAQLKAVTDEIKDISKEKFIELYTDRRNNPNTFLIKDGEGCVMVIPMDRYTKIKDEERAEYLKSQYGDEVVTEDIKYVFNNEVLERNMKAIETLISNAKNISDYDKENLITPIIEYSVAKGFIDKIYEYEDMQKVLDDIQPVIALKNCGGKMELGGETSSDDFIANIYEDGGATCGCSHKYEDGGEMDSDFIANIYEDGQYEYANGGGVGSLTKTIQINTQSINEFLELLNEQGFKKPKFIKNVKEVEGKFPYPTNYAIYEVTAETPFQKELLTDFFHKYEFKNGGMFAKGGGVESKISKEELESKVGRKLNGWNDDKIECNGKVYEKCFLKPYYKIIN